MLEWLRELRRNDPKAWNKCLASIDRLALFGYELRRPQADLLRAGIHELRIRKGHVNYRILYFFHGQAATVVLAHALTKEDVVPDFDIARAIRCKERFFADPEAHTFKR